MTSRFFRTTLLLLVLGFVSPGLAEANAGIPMIMLLWPGAWLLFVPIVVLEAQVARRLFSVPWRSALMLSGEANLYSTLAGIPGAWLALFVLEAIAGGLASLLPDAQQASWGAYLLAPFMAPWFAIWGPEDAWLVPAAAMWLCVAFFFVSVWLERRVLSSRPYLASVAVRRWSWEANLLSYGMIEIILGGLLLWELAS